MTRFFPNRFDSYIALSAKLRISSAVFESALAINRVDADACSDGDPASGFGLFDGVSDSLSSNLGLVRRKIGKTCSELIAAPLVDFSFSSDYFSHHLHNFIEAFIAFQMAVRIVYSLKIVEINYNESHCYVSFPHGFDVFHKFFFVRQIEPSDIFLDLEYVFIPHFDRRS